MITQSLVDLFPKEYTFSSHFRINGYDIIDDVLSESDVQFGVKLFKKWYAINSPQEPPHGVQKFYNCGHSAFAWFTRTRTRVKNVFAKIWGTSELVVSFDGYCYWPKSENRRNTMWLHTDQSLKNREFMGVQAIVAYTDNLEGGFYCIPRSHVTHYAKVISDSGTSSTHWTKYTPEQIEKISELARHEPELIYLKKGQMLIWDSRLVHQNWYAPEERLVQYVSYMPRSGLKYSQAVKRVTYFDQKRTTSHWAYPVRVNSLQPRTFGDESRLIDYSTVKECEDGEKWMAENKEDILKLV